MHKSAYVEPDLGPKRLVIRLEDNPLGSTVEALLYEKGRTSDWNILPLRCQAIVALQSARAPYHAAHSRHGSQAVYAQLIQLAVLVIGQRHAQLRHAH